jgi:hypothetical protein
MTQLRRKSLQKTAAGAVLFCALGLAPAAHANAVVTDVGSCAGYLILQAPSGYALAQRAAGSPIGKGSVILGDIHGVGLLTARLVPGGMVQVRVDNFRMSYAAATQLLAMRCGVPGSPAFP